MKYQVEKMTRFLFCICLIIELDQSLIKEMISSGTLYLSSITGILDTCIFPLYEISNSEDKIPNFLSFQD